MPTCLQTDGTGYVLVNHGFWFHKYHFTVEAWVRLQGGGTILTNKAAGGGGPEHGGLIFSISNDGRIHLILDNGFALLCRKPGDA